MNWLFFLSMNKQPITLKSGSSAYDMRAYRDKNMQDSHLNAMFMKRKHLDKSVMCYLYIIGTFML